MFQTVGVRTVSEYRLPQQLITVNNRRSKGSKVHVSELHITILYHLQAASRSTEGCDAV